MPKINIAIDGFSSTGKSTIAKLIAKHFSYTYIDTGAMYRCLTLFGMRNGWINEDRVDEQAISTNLHQIKVSFDHSEGRSLVFLNDEDVSDEIRSMAVSQKVSVISQIKEVREYLVHLQQELGKEKGVVMDGRDIGSVVFPDADLKLFITASPKIRAKRRFDELKGKGVTVDYDTVCDNIEKRDSMDTSRKESPLVQTDDAVLFDNSNLNPEEQMRMLIALVKCRIN